MSSPRDLASLIEEHLRRRRAARLSRSRLFEDRRALGRLTRVLKNRLGTDLIAPSSVRAEDLESVLLDITRRGLSASTVGAHIASFRVFFTDLFAHGLLLTNPAARLAGRVTTNPPRNVPSQDDVHKLLQMPDGTTEVGIRDRAILELLYGSGLRLGEALGVRISDLDLSEQILFVRQGKGNKDRVVPITQAAARAVTFYLAVRPASRHSQLFLGVQSARPIHDDSFRLAWRRYVEAAGLRQITPHALRHACALHLLENGADVVSVKNLLGHASLQTTALYLRLTTRHLKEALQRHHPRGR